MSVNHSLGFQAVSGYYKNWLQLCVFLHFVCISLYFVIVSLHFVVKLCILYIIPTKQCLMKSPAPCRVIDNNERDNDHNEYK